MCAKYDIEDWASGTTLGRRVFNYRYSLPTSEFRGWTLLKVVTMQESQDVTEKVYIWQRAIDPGHQVRISITERHTWQLAQQSLHEQLINSMRPDIPKGTKKLAELGDVVFVGREPQTDIAGAISFTRGNVCVSVSSVGEKNVDVSDIATHLDHTLSEPPTERDVEKGKVRALTPRAVAIKANEAYTLIEDLQEAASRGEWLKIIVPDGELSRKGNALIYVSAQGGEKHVGTFAVSRD